MENSKKSIRLLSIRWRNLIIPALIGCATGTFCAHLMAMIHGGAADFGFALHAARDLLHGLDPYRHPVVSDYAPYPLTAALVAMPFSFLPDEIAAGLFIGLSSALLAWCLLRYGQNWPFLLLLSWPFVYGIMFVQWVPLVLCLWFLPSLLPMILVKPQIALPLVLAGKINRTGVLATMILLAVSLLIYPSWPWVWIRQLHGYQGFSPPLFTLPLGPLLFLVLFRWREKRSWLLLLMAAMPQRVVYDQLALLLVANSRKERLALVLISWVTLPMLLYYNSWGKMPGGWHFWIILTLYVPALAIILLPNKESAISKFVITESLARLSFTKKRD
jgi:hypothetical protein